MTICHRFYWLISDGYTLHCWPPMPLFYHLKNRLFEEHTMTPIRQAIETLKDYIEGN